MCIPKRGQTIRIAIDGPSTVADNTCSPMAFLTVMDALPLMLTHCLFTCRRSGDFRFRFGWFCWWVGRLCLLWFSRLSFGLCCTRLCFFCGFGSRWWIFLGFFLRLCGSRWFRRLFRNCRTGCLGRFSYRLRKRIISRFGSIFRHHRGLSRVGLGCFHDLGCGSSRRNLRRGVAVTGRKKEHCK